MRITCIQNSAAANGERALLWECPPAADVGAISREKKKKEEKGSEISLKNEKKNEKRDTPKFWVVPNSLKFL